MSKFTIEGNINFQEELYKLLDEDSENEDELCKITGLPLKDKSVMLECKHHFNYEALYKEIYKQKYEFKTYNTNQLSENDLQKFRKSKLDYFIKCPYCRNIQFTVLPYYQELGLKEIYGINSLDKTLPNTVTMHNHQSSYNNSYPVFSESNHTFNMYDTQFKIGQCCQSINLLGDKCSYKYVANIPNTGKTYCTYHYKMFLKNHNVYDEKKKLNELKTQVKKEGNKLLEEKNAEREAKGLPPLKRLLIINKKTENVVKQQYQPIQQYVFEEENSCNAVLKSGPNKGKKCSCKKVELNGLCKRHCPKVQIND